MQYSSFIDFLESMTIAMEADDITGDTANAVRNITGENTDTAPDSANREDEENLEQVDDIFGTQDNNQQNNNEQNENASDNEDSEQSDDTSNEGNEDESGDGSAEEDPNLENNDDSSSDNPEDKNNFTDKNKIRDHLAQLYSIINGDIDIIMNSISNINNSETIAVMNSILNHFRNCKSMIYKTLTKDLTTIDYPELLKRYITLKRVYDISIKMMETYFKEVKDDKIK